MNTVLTILAVVGTVGAVDVLYFHLYRFRLYAQPGCVAEEITHLIRHLVFVALLVVCTQPATGPWPAAAAVLFFVDIANGAIDVLLEKGSREGLGGLPSTEYLIHVLSTFGTGAAAAAYWFALGSPAAHLDGLLGLQVGGMVVAGAVLFVVEAALFAQSLSRRAGRGAIGAEAY